ncbi:hypothetical protein SISNIDRAFT_295742 [Sistotremastrum niveocremeum HHB9708]|uniref:Uncharacterized protein n=1 Tax=Sistotremastrum niveocremeum HHB9708 TaxID=1314777 RepID=A0A164NKD3_9AGAM|nr:hypothetical protein SISNIDRAFT_295742 [Sistotremastrum niveocremeum HHB9708]
MPATTIRESHLQSRTLVTRDHGASRYVIIGVAVGALGVLLLLGLGSFFLREYRKGRACRGHNAIGSRPLATPGSGGPYGTGKFESESPLGTPDSLDTVTRKSRRFAAPHMLRTAFRTSDGSWAFSRRSPMDHVISHGLDNIPAAPRLPPLAILVPLIRPKSYSQHVDMGDSFCPSPIRISLPGLDFRPQDHSTLAGSNSGTDRSSRVTLHNVLLMPPPYPVEVSPSSECRSMFARF